MRSVGEPSTSGLQRAPIAPCRKPHLGRRTLQTTPLRISTRTLGTRGLNNGDTPRPPIPRWNGISFPSSSSPSSSSSSPTNRPSSSSSSLPLNSPSSSSSQQQQGNPALLSMEDLSPWGGPDAPGGPLDPTHPLTSSALHSVDDYGDETGDDDAAHATATSSTNGLIHTSSSTSSSSSTSTSSSSSTVDAEDASLEPPRPTPPAAGRAVYEVMRIEPSGACRRLYVRRRDLIKANYLQPRDLRRIDPQMALSKSLQGQTLLVKELIMIINIGSVKILCSAGKALLFEPQSQSSRRFLDLVIPKLKSGSMRRRRRSGAMSGLDSSSSSSNSVDAPMSSSSSPDTPGASLAVDLESLPPDSDNEEDDGGNGRRSRGPQPFELEMIESALMVATGTLDTDLLAVGRELQSVLAKLPLFINPKNLEELRKVKSVLVELESRADALRELLEELLEDEDELREFNLSSRPRREEKQRQRERERLERELEREKIALEEEENDKNSGNDDKDNPSSSRDGGGGGGARGGVTSKTSMAAKRLATRRKFRGINYNPELSVLSSGNSASSSSFVSKEASAAFRASSAGSGAAGMTEEELLEEDYEDAIEELEEEEEAEEELAEIEDLLEYYLQRASTTQAEAERSLQLARDLEESIAVNLSARRFEVNRLELALAIGSFSAACGALIAGIFGMNLKSYLESAGWGFFGVLSFILSLCFTIGFSLYTHTRSKRIF